MSAAGAAGRHPKRRVAITGLGAASCCGIGAAAFFDGLCGPPPEGERRGRDFDPSAFIDDAKELRRTDRFAQLALAAASLAIEDAGGLHADRDRTGVVFGA